MTERDARWRRDLYDPRFAHLPAPEEPTYRGRSGRRWRRALCDRFLQPDKPADSTTLRCPDCARIDADESDEPDEPDESVGPGPGAAAR
jgi:hypothetical protein